MFFLVEESQHMKLMTGAFNKKSSLAPKNNVTFILKTVFLEEIVNMISRVSKLSVLLCVNPVTIPYRVFEDIYFSLNNWDC